MSRLTPTQLKLLRLLSDGRPHTPEELQSLCPDDMTGSVRMHVSNLRKFLQPRGEDIVCVLGFQRRIYYRRVIVVGTGDAFE